MDNSRENEGPNFSFLHMSFPLNKLSWNVKLCVLGKCIKSWQVFLLHFTSLHFTDWNGVSNLAWTVGKLPSSLAWTSPMVLPTHLIVSFSWPISFSCIFKNTKKSRIMIPVQTLGHCCMKITVNMQLLQSFRPWQSKSNIWTEVRNVKWHIDLETIW